MKKLSVLVIAAVTLFLFAFSVQAQILPISRHVILSPYTSCPAAAAELSNYAGYPSGPTSFVWTGDTTLPCLKFEIVYADLVWVPPSPVPVTWLEFGGTDKFTRADYFLRQVKLAGYAHTGLVWTREETIIAYGF